MDIIFMRELKVETFIGVYDWEQRVKQPVSIDFELPADIARAAASDDVVDTLNYKAIAKRIIEFVGEQRCHLVETLAENVAKLVMDEFSLPWIRLTINKPGAIRGARDVGVTIERGQRPDNA